MGDFFELQAPQWVDFTDSCSPLRIQDFFDKTHEVHERIEDHIEEDHIKNSTSENTESAQPVPQTDATCANTLKVQAELDVIKSTPIKVISPKHNNEVIAETTYGQVFSDAIKKWELCKKPKIRETPNKTRQESNAFKTPNMPKISKLSKSAGYRSASNKCVQPKQNSVTKSAKVNKSICISNNNTSANTKETSVNALYDESHIDISKKLNDLVINDSEGKKEKQDKEEDKEYNKEHEQDIKQFNKTDDKECNEENDKSLLNESEYSIDDNKEIKEGNDRDNVDATIEKDNRPRTSNKHTVLTWCNHRRSLQKRRLSVKKYVSLAEAVSRFQTETPQRFRTRSNKENMSMSLNISKLTQNRLKPTIPISPALVSKNRTRPVTALSREEREKLEVEEMRKYQIKANPIPPNVLRRSRVVTKTKKSSAAPSNSTQSNEEACATNVLEPKNPLSHRDKASSNSKNVVTKLIVNDPSNIVVEHEELAFFGIPKDRVVKNVTRIMPFSFEARNKNLQMKKEQRLKSLQEANNTKVEFHARPVPNFSKPPTPTQQQQQQNIKKSLLPCPFSFDDRNKKAIKRKEQLVKQVLEEDKRARVFRANPVPTFKPVMVRGRSKEHLLVKDKNMASEQAENQENKEPNVNSSKMERETIPKSKNTISVVDKQKAPLKVLPPKLNTDKRAKERHEFDEKVRRKEIEQETKRHETEKKKLESEKEMKAKLRKQAEVKARPMPAYKPLVIVKATKQLTNPQSPAFASKVKSKQT